MRIIIKTILAWRRKMIRTFYTAKVLGQCASYKGPVVVNGPSSVTKNCYFGSNVNFNGMQITGGGKVTIGDNFHSGPGCLFICQNHTNQIDRLNNTESMQRYISTRIDILEIFIPIDYS